MKSYLYLIRIEELFSIDDSNKNKIKRKREYQVASTNNIIIKIKK